MVPCTCLRFKFYLHTGKSFHAILPNTCRDLCANSMCLTPHCWFAITIAVNRHCLCFLTTKSACGASRFAEDAGNGYRNGVTNTGFDDGDLTSLGYSNPAMKKPGLSKPVKVEDLLSCVQRLNDSPTAYREEFVVGKQRTIVTVKLVYKGHLRDQQNVALIHRRSW